MILSWYSPTNFQYSMVIQIFCRTERKSLQLVLPCVLLRQFHETRMICEKKLLACQILWRKCNGRRLLQTLKCCYFDIGIILREFLDRNDLEWEIYLYDIYSLVASLIINLTFHYTFIKFVTNDQEGAKKWGNKLFFCAILALTQFVSVSYILSLTFYLHHVLVLCFLLAFYKNCVDPRPQVLEGLKRVYGLKFL